MGATAIVLLVCVLGVLGTYDVRKGVLLHNYGEAVIVDKYALIKLNISVIDKMKEV